MLPFRSKNDEVFFKKIVFEHQHVEGLCEIEKNMKGNLCVLSRTEELEHLAASTSLYCCQLNSFLPFGVVSETGKLLSIKGLCERFKVKRLRCLL
jgi:hypothetical protein